jgi:hypothetical protein
MRIADQSEFADGLAGTEDRDNNKLAARQRHSDADAARCNQVQRVCGVALMEDHFLATVNAPSQRSD